jgi:hypothetical protein
MVGSLFQQTMACPLAAGCWAEGGSGLPQSKELPLRGRWFVVCFRAETCILAGMNRLVCVLGLVPLVAGAEVESEIPWGFEAVAGYRSDLVHRGFKLADDVYDYQLEAEIALSNEWSFNFSGYYGTGTGKGNDFSEMSGIAELRYDARQWSAGWTFGYRDFTSTFFRDGWESGPFFSYRLTDDLDLRAEYLYDEGAESFYGSVQLSWSQALSAKSFVSVRGGVSHVEDFYESKGFHAMDLRLSYTYLILSNVSVTPFVGGSLAIDREADDAVLGGLWFEVTF